MSSVSLVSQNKTFEIICHIEGYYFVAFSIMENRWIIKIFIFHQLSTLNWWPLFLIN